MKDYLGNHVQEGDTVLIAIRSGRTASLSRAFVDKVDLRPQFAGGMPTNMVYVRWSNLSKYWLPASHVVKLPDDMLPEKRKEKLKDVEEGVVVS